MYIILHTYSKQYRGKRTQNTFLEHNSWFYGDDMGCHDSKFEL